MSNRPRRHLASIVFAGLLVLGASACDVVYGPGDPTPTVPVGADPTTTTADPAPTTTATTTTVTPTTTAPTTTAPTTTTTADPAPTTTTTVTPTTTTTTMTPTTTAPTTTTTMTPTTTAPTTTTTMTPTTTAPTTTTTAPAAPGWRLVGGDEFNASTLDASNWVAYHNTYGDANNELACLTPGNVSDSEGALHLSAHRQTVACPGGTTEQYTSGFVGSREAGRLYPRYGRYEVRARLPHAQGMWPAFWLRHVNGSSTAEIDIMEYFHSQVPGKTTQTLHLNGVSNVAKRSAAFEPPTLNPGWHTWAVDILPDPAGVRFTMYVDGVSMMTYVDTNHAWTSADPDRTWDIAVNLAVGGKWTGQPDDTLGYLRDLNRCAQSGTAPNGCSTAGIRRVDWANPATNTYDIDYVRVYVPA